MKIVSIATTLGGVLLSAACAREPKASELRKELGQMKNGGSAGLVTIAWTEKLDSTKLGYTPNPKIDGKTLAQVITSQVPGRDDGQLCSACHNQDEAAGGYGLPIAKNSANPTMMPRDVVGTETKKPWAGKDGWAFRFINNPTKPANVKAALKAWVDGGCK